MSILFDTLMMRRTLRRRYDSLAHLDDRLLRDIGLDRYSIREMTTDNRSARLQDRRR